MRGTSTEIVCLSCWTLREVKTTHVAPPCECGYVGWAYANDAARAMADYRRDLVAVEASGQ